MKKYDSRFEQNLHSDRLKKWEFHPPDKVEYYVPHTYEIDFSRRVRKKWYYLEAKGRFRTTQEASKYKWIRAALDPTREELIFLFYNPAQPMPHARKRKDGTKQSHGEWATKNGFQWYERDNLPKWLTS